MEIGSLKMKLLRKMVTGANWKIYKKTCSEVSDFVTKLKKKLKNYNTDLMEAYILPDFVCLKTLIDNLGDFPLSFGTQDIFWEDSGPYTGEVSPLILKDLGCRFVFIGHSERKNLFGETDIILNRKVLACFRNGIIPILLVGETLEEREGSQTKSVVERQLRIGLKDIPDDFMDKLIIVYEPVWAIGQKDSAPLDIIEESHQMVRELISDIYSKNTANLTRILYGGSVNVNNGKDIIKISDVDGLAITRAALDPDNFAAFIKMTEEEAKRRYKNYIEGDKE